MHQDDKSIKLDVDEWNKWLNVHRANTIASYEIINGEVYPTVYHIKGYRGAYVIDAVDGRTVWLAKV